MITCSSANMLFRPLTLTFLLFFIVGGLILGDKSSGVVATHVGAEPTATATPCPSPRPPSNIIDACNPAPPRDHEADAKRLARWEQEKARVLSAEYPLVNTTSIDVDGDGRNDRLTYRIARWRDDFEGKLTITSAEGRILWDHDFFMSGNDLAKFLLEVLDYDNVRQWVKSVFNSKADYYFGTETRKLRADDLDHGQMEHAAEYHKTTTDKLQKEILGQTVNRTFYYRAEWREDLLQLVYIPSLKTFICYSRGY